LYSSDIRNGVIPGLELVTTDEGVLEMENRVLVTFATKYGATAEIAEKIGEVIRDSSLPVDILPTGQVKDLTSYTAVILGSAAYIGQWRKDAIKLLKSGEKTLSSIPVWLFSSGPSGEGDPVELLKGWRYPKGLQPVIESIKPRDIAVFHGAVIREKLNFFEKWILKNVKSPIGDFRDWDAITAWANGIAAEIKQRTK
jgi:menaquinone-dependent protoporphyrinogen oxidase